MSRRIDASFDTEIVFSVSLEHLPYERSNRWKNGLLNWILYLTDADALMKALAQVMTLTEFEFRICCIIKKGCNWGILSQWKRFYIWALNLNQEIWSIEDKVGLLILNASINTQIWRYILYYFAQYPSSGWRYRCFSCCQLVFIGACFVSVRLTFHSVAR